jgi:hypothetical protein
MEAQAYDRRTGPRVLVKFDMGILVGNTNYGKDEIAGFPPSTAEQLVKPQKVSESLGVMTPARYVDPDGNPSDRAVLVYPPNGRW